MARRFYILFIFLVFSVLKSQAVVLTEAVERWTDDPTLALLNEKAKENIRNNIDYNELFKMVRVISTNKILVRELADEYPEFLVLNDQDVLDLKLKDSEIKSIPESTLIQLIRSDIELNKKLKSLIDQFTQYGQLTFISDEEALQILNVFKSFYPSGSEKVLKLSVEFKKNGGVIRPVDLTIENENELGIKKVNAYSTTPRIDNLGALIPGDNLINYVVEFINQAKSEIVMNVFDFDLKPIAEALINAMRRGVIVRVGIDKNVIEERADSVGKVYEILKAASLQLNCLKCKIHPVDSTSLNHQKIISRDWTLKNQGAVLTSSGNFTSSGLNPHGDLVDEKVDLIISGLLDAGVNFNTLENIRRAVSEFRSKKKGAFSLDEINQFKFQLLNLSKTDEVLKSLITRNNSQIDQLINLAIPNANHLLIYESDVFAQLVNHELSKTIDLELRGKIFRGEEGRPYPLSGIYKIRRINAPVDRKDAFESPFILVNFSPNGAFGETNTLLANLIRHISGDIRMMQFAFSSKEVIDSLMEAIYKNDRSFQMVGETPFAMTEWSGLLALSGLTRDEEKRVFYHANPMNDFGFIDNEKLNFQRSQIRGAPQIYGMNQIALNGIADIRLLEKNPLQEEEMKNQKVVKKDIRLKFDLSSKLHHKILTIGGLVSTPGTSHNFSNGALSNQEQIIIAFDSEITEYIDSIFNYIYSQTTVSNSVACLANEINKRTNRLNILNPERDVIEALNPDKQLYFAKDGECGN